MWNKYSTTALTSTCATSTAANAITGRTDATAAKEIAADRLTSAKYNLESC